MISSYLHQAPDTTPRQWWRFLQRKLRHTQPLPAFDETHLPIFVLSTGRVGTQTLAALLALSPHLFAYHEPTPKLYGLGRLAYLYRDDTTAQSVLLEAVRCARTEAWEYALEAGRGYAETSPQLTFLAPFLLELHPQARFIHLVRHPYAVIRSGMRRRWYIDHAADRSRLIPRPDNPLLQQWEHLSPLAKIAWLWAETNRYILAFTATLPVEQRLLMQAESLFTGEHATLKQLYRFARTPLPAARKIQQILDRKLNTQKTGKYPPPEVWNKEQRQEVWQWVGEVATDLGYSA